MTRFQLSAVVLFSLVCAACGDSSTPTQGPEPSANGESDTSATETTSTTVDEDPLSPGGDEFYFGLSWPVTEFTATANGVTVVADNAYIPCPLPCTSVEFEIPKTVDSFKIYHDVFKGEMGSDNCNENVAEGYRDILVSKDDTAECLSILDYTQFSRSGNNEGFASERCREGIGSCDQWSITQIEITEPFELIEYAVYGVAVTVQVATP